MWGITVRLHHSNMNAELGELLQNISLLKSFTSTLSNKENI